MTREAIQIETTRQLRLLDRKKGKPSDGTDPGSRTELTDKGCPYYRGSQVTEKTGRGKTGSRYSEATALGGEKAGDGLRASDGRVSYGWYL